MWCKYITFYITIFYIKMNVLLHFQWYFLLIYTLWVCFFLFYFFGAIHLNTLKLEQTKTWMKKWSKDHPKRWRKTTWASSLTYRISTWMSWRNKRICLCRQEHNVQWQSPLAQGGIASAPPPRTPAHSAAGTTEAPACSGVAPSAPISRNWPVNLAPLATPSKLSSFHGKDA